MLKAIISTPIGAPINHIKDFTDYSYTNKLSDFGMAKVCISCKDRSLKNREWAELKYRMDLFCTGVDLSDNDQNGKVFDGYIHDTYEKCDEMCFELMDCGARQEWRRLRADYKRTNVSAEDVIAEIFGILNGIGSLDFTLGNIKAPKILGDVDYKYGQSFLEILQDLTKRTGGEFRFCNCILDFVIPGADCPYGVGKLLPGFYLYNPGDLDNSDIDDYTIHKTLKGYCNVRLSQDDNSTTHNSQCPVQNDTSVEECGLRECFENNQEGHNLEEPTEPGCFPIIITDPLCDNYCDVKVGDRKEAIIYRKSGDPIKFITIVLEVGVTCQGGEEVPRYVLGSTNSLANRFLDPESYTRSLEQRIRRLENR